MFNEVSAADIDLIRTWSPVDEDLDGVREDIRELFRSMRIQFGFADIVRSKQWSGVEGIDELLDIPYIDDGTRAHLLDVYLPHDAVLRRGNTLPVFIDIHGGGYTYGYKELNKNFCLRLAEKGFAVFSINYRLAPTASFVDQLSDVAAAFRWISDHLAEFPVDPHSVFVTGDSAGGTLGFYGAALSLNEDFAVALGIAPCPLPIKGAALVSSLFNVEALSNVDGTSHAPFINRIADTFFDQRFRSLEPKYRRYEDMVAELTLPPFYLNTCSEDFLEDENLLLAARLVQAGKSVWIEDWVPERGSTLGHVFPVGMTWLPESQAVLERMRKFAYERL
ncbi:alpha/beta hydrolase [Actinomycetaceae bacterium L2_0104]